MLYDRWCSVAAERRNEVALRDCASGRHWTFGELRAFGEAWESGTDAESLDFPQGHAPEFVFAVLSAWKSGKIICPLEVGQPVPQLRSIPAGCVHLKTTSGTTGGARYVAFTAEQLAADAANIVATMGLRPDWPNVGVISMAHSYGFSNLVLPLLLHGIPLSLASSPLPEPMRCAIDGEASVTLPGVPALWKTWADAGILSPKIRLAVSAGAPLSVELETRIFAGAGIKVHNFYGSSECGGIAYDETDRPRADGACAGGPMKNVTLRVGADGCLEVQGAAVGERYWFDSPSDAEPGRWGNSLNDGKSLGNGVFRTSDLAELREGRVYLRGRLGEMIHVAGRKVSPAAIEQTLLRHSGVSECLVFGVPSREAERTDEIVAVLVLSSGNEVSLRRFALETLPAWQAPRHWWVVPSIEMNARGKISRAEWRRQWLSRNQRAAASI